MKYAVVKFINNSKSVDLIICKKKGKLKDVNIIPPLTFLIYDLDPEIDGIFDTDEFNFRWGDKKGPINNMKTITKGECYFINIPTKGKS